MSSFLPLIMWWVPRVSPVTAPGARSTHLFSAFGQLMQMGTGCSWSLRRPRLKRKISEDHDVLHIFQVWLKLRKHHAIYCNIMSSLFDLYIIDICRFKKKISPDFLETTALTVFIAGGSLFRSTAGADCAPAARHNFSRRTRLERRHPFRPSHRSKRNEKWRLVQRVLCPVNLKQDLVESWFLGDEP